MSRIDKDFFKDNFPTPSQANMAEKITEKYVDIIVDKLRLEREVTIPLLGRFYIRRYNGTPTAPDGYDRIMFVPSKYLKIKYNGKTQKQIEKEEMAQEAKERKAIARKEARIKQEIDRRKKVMDDFLKSKGVEIDDGDET